MRILITGKKGQLVSALERAFENTLHEIIKIGRPEIDIANPLQLHAKIIELKPDLVISAAAYTAVDNAEQDSETANKVNGFAPLIMARACSELSIPIIHISTEFVFSGDKITPYVENDDTNPINIYGESKLLGENAIINETQDYVILRTSWVFSEIGNNFVKSILRAGQNKSLIEIVNDQIGCPNNAHDLAAGILIVAEKIVKDKNPNLRGIFHFSGQNYVSRSQFAKIIYQSAAKAGFKVPKIIEINSSQFLSPAARPKNSFLNCQKLKQMYDIEINNWQTNLDDCVNKVLNEMVVK